MGAVAGVHVCSRERSSEGLAGVGGQKFGWVSVTGFGACDGHLQRRRRDSNPRYPEGTTDFKSAAFDHSATPPSGNLPSWQALWQEERWWMGRERFGLGQGVAIVVGVGARWFLRGRSSRIGGGVPLARV